MNELPIVTVITPTGHRPEAIKLCKKWLVNQTYLKDNIQWIIVTDEKKFPEHEERVLYSQDIYEGPLLWEEGFNTQRYSINHIVSNGSYILGDYILFFEDDDYYAPTYIEEYVYLLQKFDVVGEGNAKYFHLPTRTYKEMKNYDHTSLASLGFKKEVLPTFKRALHSGDKFFDITFWDLAKKENLNTLIFTNKNLSIGIKGMPGRKGIGVGHNPEGYTSDPFSQKLTQWIGEDIKHYKDFIGKKGSIKNAS